MTIAGTMCKYLARNSQEINSLVDTLLCFNSFVDEFKTDAG